MTKLIVGFRNFATHA